MQPSLEVPQSLSREQIETMPQIGEDIYRAVSRLPGVTANDFSASFFVRGGSGDELYVTLDGLELIEPFHLKDLGGALSIIDAQAIGSVDLTTGGFSAEYGDRLTGVFSMRSIDPRTDRTRTSAGLSVMNARVTSQGGFAGGTGGWLLSARRGYVDLALKLAKSTDSLKPRYHDLFGKVQLARPRGGRLAAHVLHAGDNLRYLDTPDPSIRSRYGSSYAWLTWEERLGERLRQQTVASVGRLTWRRDGDGLFRGEETAEVIDRRTLSAIGLRQDWSWEIAPRFLLKWGGDLRRERADYDYFAWSREQFAEGGEIESVYDTTAVAFAPTGSRLAAYVAPRVRLHPSLTVEGGLRFDRNSAGDDEILSPRVNIAWQPRAGTSIRAAWGRYSQSQSLHSIQAPDGVDRLAPAERAQQRVLGVEQLLPWGLAARAEAYDRRLTSVRPRWVNAGPGIEMFPELTWDRLLVTPTSARARGVEVMLSHPGGARIDWSLGYALAKATERIGERTVPRAIDQRHTVSGDFSVHPASNKWRLSVATLWHSGWPYTPTIVEIDTLRNTNNEFSLFIRQQPGELNSARLASYRRVDLRWTRYFDTRNGRIALFLELYNALNSANPRGYDIDVHVSRDRQILVMRPLSTMIPRLPTFGLSWEF
jgi:outer membrane receptor protein involved in Fe transport